MNKVILMGRVARDPEVRSTQSGKSVARTAIAVDRRGARRGDNNGQPTADFIPLIFWEQRAEFCQRYLVKGSPILVEGRLSVRNYETQDGQKRTATEVIVDNVEFAGPRPQGASFGGDNHQSDGGFGAYQPQGAPVYTTPSANPQTDEEIPF